MRTLDEMEEHITELSDEEFVICQLAREAADSGDPEYAERIARREADRDPMVHLRLFFSRVWPQRSYVQRCGTRSSLNGPPLEMR